MADFKMRGHILLAENEKKDNNNSLLTKQQSENRDTDAVEEDTVNGKRGFR